ncbi:MAG: type II toxin-antitoxin system VapC family toxin, partial [Thermoleophilaceae bacterium]
GDEALSRRLASATELHAPQLIDIEVLHALRRLVAIGQITSGRAQKVREDFAAMRVRRYPHEPLADRVWELRNSFTPADAAFIVLAETLEIPFVTCDPRLASTLGHAAEIELFAGSA